MTHIDENTLELYVLGSKMSEQVTKEIQVHIEECYGCRTVVERLEVFYRNVEADLTRPQPEMALVRLRKDLIPSREKTGIVVTSIRASIGQRVRSYIMRYPVRTGFGATAFVAAAASVAILAVQNVQKSSNPDYVYFNSAQSKLEVFSEKDERLWEIPIPPAIGDAPERARVVDIDGDGTNEVVTTVPSVKPGDTNPYLLRIYSPDKTLMKQVEFVQPITFRKTQYPETFEPNKLLAEDFTGNGRNEMAVLVSQLRSPSALVLLGPTGEVLGEYWHFGILYGMGVVDLNHDGKKEILAYGINDVEDANGGSFPVVIVLDPSRIKGRIESDGSPGFGFQKSQAELYYMRLPNSDIGRMLGHKIRTFRMEVHRLGTQETMSFWTSSTVGEGIPMFEFVLSPDLQILAVRPEDQTVRVRSDLVQQGKLKGSIDKDYLKALKDGVEYWDGKEWRKELARVEP